MEIKGKEAPIPGLKELSSEHQKGRVEMPIIPGEKPRCGWKNRNFKRERGGVDLLCLNR